MIFYFCFIYVVLCFAITFISKPIVLNIKKLKSIKNDEKYNFLINAGPRIK